MRFVAFTVTFVALTSASAAPAQDARPPEPPDGATAPGEAAPRLVMLREGFQARVGALAFSPDGRWLAGASWDKTVRLWDLKAGRWSRVLRGQAGADFDGTPSELAFSPDGRWLVVGVSDSSAEGTLRVYDTGDLREIASVLPGHPGSNGVRTLLFSEDGGSLVSVGFDGSVHFWDWPARRRVGVGRVQGDLLYASLLPSSSVLVTFSNQGAQDRTRRRLWSARLGREVDALTPRESADLDAREPGWRLRADEAEALLGRIAEIPLPFGDTGARLLNVRLDTGDALLAGYRDLGAQGVRYWQGYYRLGPGGPAADGTVHGEGYITNALALSADRTMAAHGDTLGSVYLWPTDRPESARRLKSSSLPIYEVAFDDSGLKLSIGTKPYASAEWRLNHRAALEKTFACSERRLLDRPSPRAFEPTLRLGEAVLSQTARGFAHAPGDGQVRTYDLHSSAMVWCLSYLRTEKLGFRSPVVYSQYDGSLNCWDPEGGLIRRSFLGASSVVTSVSESKDGRFLAGGSTDGTVRVWSLENLRRLPFVDFDIGGDDFEVTYVKPGGEADRAGVVPGHVWRGMDGIDVRVLFDRFRRGDWPYRAGQLVRLDMQGADGPFQVSARLVETGDMVDPLVSLSIDSDGQWVAWTQDGFFDSTLQGDSLIGWQVDRGRGRAPDLFTAKQFQESRYAPGLVQAVLETGDAREAVRRLRPRDAGPVPVPLSKILPPRVRIQSPPEGARVRNPSVKVEVLVEAQGGEAVSEVQIHASSISPGSKGVSAHAPAEPSSRRTFAREVQLLPGLNRIEAVAVAGAPASDAVTVEFVPGPEAAAGAPRPDLRVVSIGVSRFKNQGLGVLKFAGTDAHAFVRPWARSANRVYGKVETLVLDDENATFTRIGDAFDWLAKEAKPSDVSVLFLSSHGAMLPGGAYYFATHDFDPERPMRTGISPDEIAALARKLQGRFLVFVDTCRAAALGRFQNDSLDALRPLSTVQVRPIVYASCRTDQAAWEQPEWGHSAFTKAFLDTAGDPGSEARPVDGFLSTLELELNLRNRVKELVQDHPQEVTVNRRGDDPVIDVLAISESTRDDGG